MLCTCTYTQRVHAKGRGRRHEGHPTRSVKNVALGRFRPRPIRPRESHGYKSPSPLTWLICRLPWANVYDRSVDRTMSSVCKPRMRGREGYRERDREDDFFQRLILGEKWTGMWKDFVEKDNNVLGKVRESV